MSRYDKECLQDPDIPEMRTSYPTFKIAGLSWDGIPPRLPKSK